MDRIKFICLTSGTAVIICGYWLLAVPADLPYEQVLFRANTGMLTVITGGIVLIGGIKRRS